MTAGENPRKIVPPSKLTLRPSPPRRLAFLFPLPFHAHGLAHASCDRQNKSGSAPALKVRLLRSLPLLLAKTDVGREPHRTAPVPPTHTEFRPRRCTSLMTTHGHMRRWPPQGRAERLHFACLSCHQKQQTPKSPLSPLFPSQDETGPGTGPTSPVSGMGSPLPDTPVVTGPNSPEPDGGSTQHLARRSSSPRVITYHSASYVGSPARPWPQHRAICDVTTRAPDL